MSVFRSNTDIYAQLIDDANGVTLAQHHQAKRYCSTKSTKTEKAKLVGAAIAAKAKELGIKTVVFDRGGYIYHGRVKAVAEGAREGGLNFNCKLSNKNNINGKLTLNKVKAGDLELKDKVVAINRVVKTTKGGRAFSFSALVVVGNEAGVVGHGLGKAKEVQEAITKGIEDAKKNLIKVPILHGTIPHEQLS